MTDNIIQDTQNKINEINNNITNKLSIYNSLLINYKNNNDYYNNIINEINRLSKIINDNDNDVYTNERKSYYQEQQVDLIKSYYNYLIIAVYYVAFICLLVFYIFTLYKNNKGKPIIFDIKFIIFNIVIFLLFILYPFYGPYLLGKFLQNQNSNL